MSEWSTADSPRPAGYGHHLKAGDSPREIPQSGDERCQDERKAQHRHGQHYEQVDAGLRVVDEVVSDGDVASARTHSSGTYYNHDEQAALPAEWREIFVCQRQDAGWRIALYMFQSVP